VHVCYAVHINQATMTTITVIIIIIIIIRIIMVINIIIIQVDVRSSNQAIQLWYGSFRRLVADVPNFYATL